MRPIHDCIHTCQCVSVVASLRVGVMAAMVVKVEMVVVMVMVVGLMVVLVLIMNVGVLGLVNHPFFVIHFPA